MSPTEPHAAARPCLYTPVLPPRHVTLSASRAEALFSGPCVSSTEPHAAARPCPYGSILPPRPVTLSASCAGAVCPDPLDSSGVSVIHPNGFPAVFAFALRALHDRGCPRYTAVIDSGATAHITSDRSLFDGYVRSCDVAIGGVGSGNRAVAVGSGSFVLDGFRLPLSKLYLVSDPMAYTLLSVRLLRREGIKCDFGEQFAVMSSRGKPIFTTTAGDGLYTVQGEPPRKVGAIFSDEIDESRCDAAPVGYLARNGSTHGITGNYFSGSLGLCDLLHRRLGHVSLASSAVRKDLEEAFGKSAIAEGMALCDSCVRSKMHAFRSRTPALRRATRPLEFVHFDLSPAIPVQGVGGYTGYIMVCDEFTDTDWALNIRRKSDVLRLLNEWKVMAEVHFASVLGSLLFPTRLANLRSDGAGENTSDEVKKWCAANGIWAEISAPYCQWQDGRSERHIRTAWEGSEAIRKQANLPDRFWPFTLQAFLTIRALLPTSSNPVSPWERWWCVRRPFKQRIAHLRIVGCACWVFVPKELRRKLEDKARECVFLGYSDRAKAYRVLHLATGKIGLAVSVVFDETRFPMQEGRTTSSLVPQFEDSGDVVPAPWHSDVESAPETLPDPVFPVSGSAESLPAGAPTQPAPASSCAAGRPYSVPPTPIPMASLDSGPATPSPTLALDSESLDKPDPTPARRRSGRIRSLGRLPVLSPAPVLAVIPEIPLDSVMEDINGFEIDAIIGHRVRYPVGAYGDVDVARPYDEYRVSWTGDYDPTWEPAESLDAASETLDEYISSHQTSISNAWAKHTGEPALHARVEGAIAALPRQVCCGAPASIEEAIAVVPDVRHSSSALHAIRTRVRTEPLSPSVVDRIRHRVDLIELAMTAPVADCDVVAPSSVDQAKRSPGWKASMDAELECMSHFGVWKLVPRPPGSNVIGCKWVWKTKFDADGIPVRLKSRLTAKGFTQRRGIDYLETWAPTCRQRTFRLMLAEASLIPPESLVTAAWDTTAAFLHAEMDHVAYMEQPPGFIDSAHPDYVCLLQRSIYGLKSSSRLFYLMLRDNLLALGAVQSVIDPCMFVVNGSDGEFVKLVVHVDDVGVVSNCRALYDSTFATLKKVFAFRQEPLEHFLGVVIKRRGDGAFCLSQWPYIKELLVKLGLESAPMQESPALGGSAGKLNRDMSPSTPHEQALMDRVPFKTAVGALFWISRATRPDIAHAVSSVAKYSSDPGLLHWKAVSRIFGYLKRTMMIPLVLKATGNINIEAYCDSDFAGCPDTALSTTGFAVRAGGALVAWKARIQDTWAQNATEAEYLAALRTSNETAWWRAITGEMWPGSDRAPTPVWCDNDGAIMQSQHQCSFENSKHYQISDLLLRKRHEDGDLRLMPIRTDHNIADVFTKNLAPVKFKGFASALLGASVF